MGEAVLSIRRIPPPTPQVFKCTSVQVYKCSSVQVYKCTKRSRWVIPASCEIRLYKNLAELMDSRREDGINAATLPAAYRAQFNSSIDTGCGKLKDVLIKAEAAGVVRLQSKKPRSGGAPVLMIYAVVSPRKPAKAAPAAAKVVELIDHRFLRKGGAPAHVPKKGKVEVVISFDTTGSMYGHLDQVRRNLAEMITTLIKRVPGIRIGIIAHGDYCDGDSSYIIKFLPLMTDYDKLTDFVNDVGKTGGGDAPECYELALNKANKAMGWSAGARSRALVLIGDDNPHEPGYECDGKVCNINWRNQVKSLADKHVQIYAVHAGGAAHSKPFYQALATSTRGQYIPLGEMGAMSTLVAAVCIHTSGDRRQLDAYERELRVAGRLSIASVQIFVEIRKTIVTVIY
eukprot:m.135499 g.135499  ORF g.135499 m.135499 type:complete len:400 (-) comp22601_c0_seq2:254-1453(-)